MTNRRSALALIAAIGLAPLAARAETPPMTPFTHDAFARALAEGKPVLVHVTTGWCPICKAQKPILEKLRTEPRFKDFSAFAIDFDADKASAREVGAQHQSTLIVYKAGKEVRRSVGEAQAEWIADLLDDAL